MVKYLIILSTFVCVCVCFLNMTFLTAEIAKCTDSQNAKYNHFHEICEEFEAGTIYKRLHVNVSV